MLPRHTARKKYWVEGNRRNIRILRCGSLISVIEYLSCMPPNLTAFTSVIVLGAQLWQLIESEKRDLLIEGPGPLPNITQGPEKSTWSQFLVAGHISSFLPQDLGRGLSLRGSSSKKHWAFQKLLGGCTNPLSMSLSNLAPSCCAIFLVFLGLIYSAIVNNIRTREKILELCSPTTIGKGRLKELLTLARRT